MIVLLGRMIWILFGICHCEPIWTPRGTIWAYMGPHGPRKAQIILSGRVIHPASSNSLKLKESSSILLLGEE